MALPITHEDRENERLFFEEERKRVPELFALEPMVDDDAALRSIGIQGVISGHRPLGYLKLIPQDFIVEEISRDGATHTVEFEHAKPATETEGGTYYADLVKVGISTLDAKPRLAHALDIDEKNIGYAGIKDRFALTSQLISMRGIKEPERLLNLADNNYFLKNLHRGKGVLVNTDLQGNRFTVTVRTAEPITAAQKQEMEEKVAEAKQDGFWNFFYFQRFGTPRLLSHILGRLIIKGQYEETIKFCCIHTGTHEPPYINAIREAIERQWGDWNAILGLIDLFPAYFIDERTFIHHLAERPGDYLGALRALPDQIRLWVYAYASYLFNRKLSELIKTGSVPLNLPFITSHDPKDWKPYQAFLDEDHVKLPSPAFRDFHPIVYIASRRCPTLQPLTIHNAVFQDRLAIFSFSLPKGSYATTFLMNFFTLSLELPAGSTISKKQVDVEKILGVGTLAPTLERFKKALTKTEAEATGGGTAEE